MAITVTHRYDYRLGVVEQNTLEILNERYGRVAARRWHKSHNYAIELATLDPEPSRVDLIAYPWLIAGSVSLLGTIAFISFLIYNSGNLSLASSVIGTLILIAMTLLFAAMFFIKTSRRLVFCARFTRLPLLVIPLPWRKEATTAAKSFAAEIGRCSQQRYQKLDYTAQEMRAGEMRMLRRLSEEGAIDKNLYTQAKSLLLNHA